MTTDTASLVAALRVAKRHPPTEALLDEAIFEIDRLTAENARLRKALIAVMADMPVIEGARRPQGDDMSDTDRRTAAANLKTVE